MKGSVLERARAGLRSLAEEFRGGRVRLLQFQASLPPPAADASLEDVDDLDPLSEMHAVIGNAVRDSLDPLIRDLLAAAAYEPGGSPAGGPRTGKVDVHRNDEATRQALYDLVVRQNFTGQPREDPGDDWAPPYTAEQAGLEVFWLHGRWFATWLKLEMPSDLPESQRRELLVLAEDERRPGRVICHCV
ncbi:MAG TPA: hypothetical protein VF756_02725 [Thermoanaerobaculia bacterium]